MDTLLAKHSLLVRLERLLELLRDSLQRLLERTVFVAHELGENRIVMLKRRVLLKSLVDEDCIGDVHFFRLDLLLVILIEKCLLLLFKQFDHE